MPLSESFERPPGETPHHYFSKVYRDLKKAVQSSKDTELLEREMQKFIDACRQMNWHYQTNSVQHKGEGEKIANKIYTEFKRYIADLRKRPGNAQSEDLLTSLKLMEPLIYTYQVT